MLKHETQLTIAAIQNRNEKEPGIEKLLRKHANANELQFKTLAIEIGDACEKAFRAGASFEREWFISEYLKERAKLSLEQEKAEKGK